MLFRKIHSIWLVLLMAAALPLHAQEKKDDRVRLISAKTAQLMQIDGVDYRKVVGPARFLHNDTYLICDTALWNVKTNIIDATGHVRIIQDRTTLSSTYLQYNSDENMARFRGDLVQLQDKDGNTLRTRYLDYNTKDSVAVFQSGGAMKDKDGQIMESRFGIYDAKAKLFTFNQDVNMYMDTTFIKTSRLEYRSDLSTAFFGYGTDMWQDDSMLSADDGWYDRSRELFFFQKNVHLLTKTQEAWADTMYYYRALNNLDMQGAVELMDTTRNAYALAGRFEYQDSVSRITMTRDPALMSISDENGVRDTLYLGGDLILMQTYKKCDIPDTWIAASEKRLKDISGDPVMEYRRKAAEEAAKKAAEEAKRADERAGKKTAAAATPPDSQPSSGNKPPITPADIPTTPTDTMVTPPVDSLAMPRDSLMVQAADSLTTQFPDSLSVQPPDSLSAQPADSLAAVAAIPEEPPVDSTKINFFRAVRNVRLFRNNMQMACDSLTYSDLDSLARMFGDPKIYNEGNKQYTADSIYVVVKDREAEKAHLLGNAFISIQEAPEAFDQIRSVEMVAYFDSTRTLQRFDALGGASSLFYLTEDDALATVNKVESKMIYATFVDGNIDHLYYYDNPKNDGYPTVQLPKDDKTLKGFRWDPKDRPASPRDVTSLVPRKSQRVKYLKRPHAKFDETDTYFPGYTTQLYRDIARRDSLAVAREKQRQEAEALERMVTETDVLADSLMHQSLPDSLGLADSLKVAADTLVHTVPADSTGTRMPPADSLHVSEPPVVVPPTPEEIRAREKAEKEAEKARIKAEKQAAREAKWAEEDRKYAERQAAKAQKKLDRERAKKLKTLKRLEKKAQRERKKLERYLERERKRQEKKQLKANNNSLNNE